MCVCHVLLNDLLTYLLWQMEPRLAYGKITYAQRTYTLSEKITYVYRTCTYSRALHTISSQRPPSLSHSVTPSTSYSSSSSLWREAFSRSLPPLRSFARTVGPPLAAGPRSLLHPCRSRSGGSRWSTVSHRRVSTPVKAAHHPSSWCRFVGSGLLVQTYSTTHLFHKSFLP